MTTSPPEHPQPAPTAVPPPGCPAHGLYAEGLQQLHAPKAVANTEQLYADLREKYGAVAPVEIPGGVRAWLVLGHRENLEVMRTPSRFSADSRLWRDSRLLTPEHPLAPLIAWQPLVNFSEGEDQRRLRGAVNASLAEFNNIGVRRRIQHIANTLIDGFCRDGHADLVAQYAQQVPMLTMMRLLGVPEETAPALIAACQDLIAGTDTAAVSNQFVMRVLQDLVAARKAGPENDLPSFLIQHDARLNDTEVAEHLRHTLVAAHTTTSVLLADTIEIYLTDVKTRASLNGSTQTLEESVDHILWVRPPLAVLPARYATGPTKLGEQTIEEGDMVLMGLAAGNADPQVRPDLKAPMHGNRSHLAFSGGGHECPGQNIGRAIVETACDVLLTRLPDLHVSGETQRVFTWMAHPLITLPVEFTRKAPEAPVTTTHARVAQQVTSALPQAVPQPLPSAAAAATIPAAAPARRPWWRSLVGR
ncbi:cytochrome P450 [Actinacidiphila sp. bgisy167]|uniref:cytochrome P450 n=1 Tax=Actinacidiphila sp. bgisy167 TaxID=3413797 RepID=UPI003D72789E